MTVALTFTMTGLTLPGATTLEVARFTSDEALSKPYRAEVLLASNSASLDAVDFINRTAKVGVTSDSLSLAAGFVFAGLVTAFEQREVLASGSGVIAYYQVVLEPRLSLLARRRNTAAFVDPDPAAPSATALSVLSTVLQAYTTAVHSHLPAVSDLRTRAYRCQFDESDLDFVSRLLESEGLPYFFSHHATTFDRLDVVGPRTQYEDGARAIVRFVDPSSTPADDTLQTCVSRQELLPHRVVIRDYNPARAGSAHGIIASTTPAAVHSRGFGDIELCREDVLTEAEASRIAAIRAQELHAGGLTFSATGTATGLRPGYLFTLSGHPNSALNGKKYLVTSLRVEASQALNVIAAAGQRDNLPNSYRVAAMTAIPYDQPFDSKPVTFRPPRTTPRPRVDSTLSATIDAEGSGEYAEPDSNGCYRVVLPFAVYPVLGAPYTLSVPFYEPPPGAPASPQRLPAAKGSAPVRMAVPYSGPPVNGAASGLHLPLHKGAEVLLAFIDGDPDRPIIIGAVPNSANASVVTAANAASTVLRTAGGNLLELVDTTDKQRVVISTPYKSSKITLGDDPKGNIHLFTTGSYKLDQDTSATDPDKAAGTAFGDADWETMMGVQTDSEKNAPSTTRIRSDRSTHVYGDTYTRTRGNTSAYTWGNSYTAFMGAREDLLFGQTLTTSLSHKTDIQMGGREDIYLGFNFWRLNGALNWWEVNLGPKNVVNMKETKYDLIGTTLKVNNFEANFANKLGMTTSELKTTVSELKTGVNALKTTTNDLSTVVNSHVTTVNSLETSVATINNSLIHLLV